MIKGIKDLDKIIIDNLGIVELFTLSQTCKEFRCLKPELFACDFVVKHNNGKIVITPDLVMRLNYDEVMNILDFVDIDDPLNSDFIHYLRLLKISDGDEDINDIDINKITPGSFMWATILGDNSIFRLYLSKHYNSLDICKIIIKDYKWLFSTEIRNFDERVFDDLNDLFIQYNSIDITIEDIFFSAYYDDDNTYNDYKLEGHETFRMILGGKKYSKLIVRKYSNMLLNLGIVNGENMPFWELMDKVFDTRKIAK